MKCLNCQYTIDLYDKKHQYCPNCGARIVLPDIEYNVFSPWRGVYSTRYGGMLPFDRDAIIAQERKKDIRYGNWESWLGSYKPEETVSSGDYTARFKVLTWEKLVWDEQGKMTLVADEVPAEGVEVTYLE